MMNPEDSIVIDNKIKMSITNCYFTFLAYAIRYERLRNESYK